MLFVSLGLLLVIVPLAFTTADIMVLSSRYRKLQHGGLTRRYLLHRPRGEVTKIVLGLHGFADNARRFAYYTALHNLADANTLVVYPEAVSPNRPDLKRGWNGKICCGSGFVNELDDVGFIKELIKQLKKEYGAKDARVFATGFSNGAIFAQRLAGELPEQISGVAAVGGSLKANDKQIKLKKPVPALLMHGVYDKTVPYNGGVGASDPDFTWPPFADTVEQWRAKNGDQAETKVIEWQDTGHRWRDWRRANFWHSMPDTSREVIKFFDGLA